MRSEEELDASLLKRMWSLGWEKLDELQTPMGYDASGGASGLYGALFGRDSLWIVLLLLDVAARRPARRERVAASGARVLESLARLQGTRELDLIEEQPGKIVHVHWANTPPAMHTLPLVEGSSFCGFDQTFLFVIALRRYLEVFPESTLAEMLWPAARDGVQWMRTYARQPDSGLYAYQRRHAENPVHQVWKDSFDSISHIGFDIPPEPVAWIEVQAYAYRALLDAADLESESDALRAEAADIRHHVAGRFWQATQGCYAVAMDGVGRPVRMITSNAGHALWAGVAEAEHASAVATRLAAPDMLTSYGLRTLASSDRVFAPLAYHRGAVWPFDNAVVAGGLLRYGFVELARTLMLRVVRALSLIGSTSELYAVLPAASVIDPAVVDTRTRELLLHRRHPPENLNQGFTAAALLYCVSQLATLAEIELE